MPLDTRPWLKLTVLNAQGGSVAVLKCRELKVNPLVNGVGGTPGTVTKDTATHTVKVSRLGAAPPPEFRENARVTIDQWPGKPPVTFRILRNGIDPDPAWIKVYLRVETPEVLA